MLSILQSYSDLLLETQSKAPSGTDSAAILTVGDLKIIKTGFGVLLNASMEYSEASDMSVETLFGRSIYFVSRTCPILAT